MCNRNILVVCFAFFISTVCSSSFAQTIEPLPGTLIEGFGKATQLSGELLVSVMNGSSQLPKANPVIHVLLPQVSTRTSIVVLVKTRDGRYKGRAQYRLPEKSNSQEAMLSFPTAEINQLSKYRKGDVLCLAELEGTQTETERQYLPCSWERLASESEVIVLFNSGYRTDGGSLVVIKTPASSKEPERVKTTKVETSSVFDAEAHLRGTSTREFATITAQRYLLNNPQTEMTFKILAR